MKNFFIALSIALLGACGGQSAVESTGDITVYLDATLIDGTGAAPVGNAAVVVRDGTIVAVGARDKVEIPAGARRVDLSGKWLIPGLIDSHVHFMKSGRVYTQPKMLPLTDHVGYDQEVRWNKSHVEQLLQSYLCAGVTTVLNLGGPIWDYQVRALADQLAASPNVLSAVGPIASIEPQDLWFFLPFDGDYVTRGATTPEAMDTLLAKERARKPDALKIGYFGLPQENLATYRMILDKAVAEGRRAGIPVIAHSLLTDEIKHDIVAGVQGFAHLPVDSIDQQLLDVSLAHGTVYATALGAFAKAGKVFAGAEPFAPLAMACGQPELLSGYSSENLHRLQQESPHAFENYAGIQEYFKGSKAQDNLKRMADAGVMIGTGTDAADIGMVQGASLHDELALLEQIGLEPMRIIQAATLNGARFFQQQQRLGSIEADKQADMLILNADPLQTVKNIADIHAVVKNGQLFPHATLHAAD